MENDGGRFGWMDRAEVEGLRRELKIAQSECLRLKDECIRNDRTIAAESAEAGRLRGLLGGVRQELFNADGALSVARAELAQCRADLARMTEQAKHGRLVSDRSGQEQRADGFNLGRDEGRREAYAEFHSLRERLAGCERQVQAYHKAAREMEVERDRARHEAAVHCNAANGFRRETLAAEKRMESAEAEADRLLSVVEGLRAELAARSVDGFVPVSELDVVFSEGAAMGAEEVTLDVSQFLGALAEVDRRHGCDRCAAALGMVAREVPAVVAAMRAARPGLRRRTAR